MSNQQPRAISIDLKTLDEKLQKKKDEIIDTIKKLDRIQSEMKSGGKSI